MVLRLFMEHEGRKGRRDGTRRREGRKGRVREEIKNREMDGKKENK